MKGLRLFARQIRREHGLTIADEEEEEAAEKEKEGGGGGDEMDIVAKMEVDSDSESSGRGSGSGNGSGTGSEGEEEEEKGGKGEKPADGYREALLEAAEKGEAPGLLGEYLRGSPQLNDLLRLWDLEERKVGRSVGPFGSRVAYRYVSVVGPLIWHHWYCVSIVPRRFPLLDILVCYGYGVACFLHA